MNIYHGVCINTVAIQSVSNVSGAYDISWGIACIPQADSRTVAILKPYKPNPLYVSSTYVIHNHEGTD